MEIRELERSYADLLRDENFNKFQILAKTSNIFEILGVQTYEIRHSNFLSWLFDPNGNHGLGPDFLKKFLNDIAIDDRSNQLSIVDLQSFDYSNVRIYREWKNIDILIVFDNLTVVIENKILHYETKNQLNNYRQIIKKTFNTPISVFVFLNPDGQESSQNDVYINYSYESLITYIEQIINLYDSINNRIKIYLEDYISNLRNNIMANGEKYMLANKIYNQHRALFDFIFETKGNAMMDLKTIVEEKIKAKELVICSPTKQYIRFLTQDLEKIIPKGVVKGWKNGEAFLFEIYFYLAQNQVMIYCTVGPSDSPIRNTLLDILTPLKTHRGESKGWTSYRTKTINLENLYQAHSNNDLNQIADEIMQHVEKLVNEVEPLLLNNKERIIETQ